MTRDEELLVEQAITAWRPRDLHGAVRGHPAWHDLDADGRRDVYSSTVLSRAMEAAADPEGLSGTGHAVLARIRSR